MTTPDKNDKGPARDVFADLFQHAAPRHQPPAHTERAIRETLRGEWQQVTRRRRYVRRSAWLAAAASVTVAVLVSVTWINTAPPAIGVRVATVERQFADTRLFDAVAGQWRPLSGVGDSLMDGQSLMTGDDAGLALSWDSGGSLRLDENTRINVVSRSAVELVHGRVYFDSQPDKGAGGGLEVRTVAGAIRHIGTQFMTAVKDGRVRVAVREGAIRVTGNGIDARADAGEALELARGSVAARRNIAAYASDWRWVENTAPPQDFRGRTPMELLRWVERESGRTVKFMSGDAERLARSETLSAPPTELKPLNTLVLLQTTRLEAEVRDGEIEVRLRQ